MASGRMLKQTIATDKRLNDMSIDAEYLYLKCIPHLDRDGLIHGDTSVLWATVCPRRHELLARIDGLVDEWVNAGLVIRYATKEGDALFFTGFSKNQSIRYDREAASRYGPPPGYVRTDSGLVPDKDRTSARADEKSVNTPVETPKKDEKGTLDQLRTNSGLTPDQLPPNLNQIKGNQSNGVIDDFRSGDRDGKYVIEIVRFAGFMYLDAQATRIAMELESDYSDAQLREALGKTVEAHQKQIKTGGRGITAPLAYMRQVLLGMDTSPVAAKNGNGNGTSFVLPKAMALFTGSEK